TFNLKSTISDVQTTLTSGQNVVLFTSRKRIDGDDDPATSKAVSKTLVEIVRGIKDRPSFLVTKGSSTSSDIATEALGVRQAQVLGQILPGVPVWTIGNETLHPGLAYVIFPGNVGVEDALTLAVEKLTP
ncbi:hydroxyacid dehydrogenase, partial [bacterium]|nr:hydroxyacid dehydrogenase [bacterium]